MSKIIIWKKQDNSVMLTTFAREMTDSEIDRFIQEMKSTQDAYKNLGHFVKDQSEIPNDGQHDKWRIRQDGSIFTDANFETKAEKHIRHRTSGINKLRQLGLTDDEIGAMIK